MTRQRTDVVTASFTLLNNGVVDFSGTLTGTGPHLRPYELDAGELRGHRARQHQLVRQRHLRRARRQPERHLDLPARQQPGQRRRRWRKARPPPTPSRCRSPTSTAPPTCGRSTSPAHGTNDAPLFDPPGIPAQVTEFADTTGSQQLLSAPVALTFTDVDLNDVGYTPAVIGVTADGVTGGLPNSTALTAFLHIDDVIKNFGSSSGVVNATFSAPRQHLRLSRPGRACEPALHRPGRRSVRRHQQRHLHGGGAGQQRSAGGHRFRLRPTRPRGRLPTIRRRRRWQRPAR